MQNLQTCATLQDCARVENLLPERMTEDSDLKNLLGEAQKVLIDNFLYQFVVGGPTFEMPWLNGSSLDDSIYTRDIQSASALNSICGYYLNVVPGEDKETMPKEHSLVWRKLDSECFNSTTVDPFMEYLATINPPSMEIGYKNTQIKMTRFAIAVEHLFNVFVKCTVCDKDFPRCE